MSIKDLPVDNETADSMFLHLVAFYYTASQVRAFKTYLVNLLLKPLTTEPSIKPTEEANTTATMAIDFLNIPAELRQQVLYDICPTSKLIAHLKKHYQDVFEIGVNLYTAAYHDTLATDLAKTHPIIADDMREVYRIWERDFTDEERMEVRVYCIEKLSEDARKRRARQMERILEALNDLRTSLQDIVGSVNQLSNQLADTHEAFGGR